MYQSATAYVAKPGETLVKHKIATLQALQTLQALPEQVQAAFRDGMNIIRFDGYPSAGIAVTTNMRFGIPAPKWQKR